VQVYAYNIVFDRQLLDSNLYRMLFGTVINEKSVIFRKKKDLREMIDPDFGLPEKLMNVGVFTEDDRQTVQSKPSLEKRNDELLHLVLQKGDPADQKFRGCLPNTDQRHVYNYIVCDGGNYLLLDIKKILNLFIVRSSFDCVCQLVIVLYCPWSASLVILLGFLLSYCTFNRVMTT